MPALLLVTLKMVMSDKNELAPDAAWSDWMQRTRQTDSIEYVMAEVITTMGFGTELRSLLWLAFQSGWIVGQETTVADIARRALKP